jgi:hypothetical protein
LLLLFATWIAGPGRSDLVHVAPSKCQRRGKPTFGSTLKTSIVPGLADAAARTQRFKLLLCGNSGPAGNAAAPLKEY